jgi:hypothetical protein
MIQTVIKRQKVIFEYVTVRIDRHPELVSGSYFKIIHESMMLKRVQHDGILHEYPCLLADPINFAGYHRVGAACAL